MSADVQRLADDGRPAALVQAVSNFLTGSKFEDLVRLPDHHRAIVAAMVAEFPGGPATLVLAADRISAPYSQARRARVIVREARPELIDLVWDGTATMYAARRVASLDHEKQAEAINLLRRGASIESILPPVQKEGAVETPQATRFRNESNASVLTNITGQLGAVRRYGLDEIQALDVSVDALTAQVIFDELGKFATSLNRVRRLLKDRISA